MRRVTRTVNVGKMAMGSGSPISVQTMWDAPLSSVDAVFLKRMNFLENLGCDLIRFSAPTIEDAETIGSFCHSLPIPVCVDIHFDYKIALRALDFPIAKLRINPGNIGGVDHMRAVVLKASDKNIPIRIGVNGGSLPENLRNLPNRAEVLANFALDEANILEQMQFSQIVLSVKDSNQQHMANAVRMLASRCDYPIHLGVTEAGPIVSAVTSGAFFLGPLIADGIGDTIRISISDAMEYEIMAARRLLHVTGNRDNPMPKLISCPRCGRATFDSQSFAKRLEPKLYSIKKNITVAVMGCVVNGPGEAREADLAITGIGDKTFVYLNGARIFSGSPDEAETFFMEQIEKFK